MPAGVGAHDARALDINPIGQLLPHRDADDALAGLLQPIGDGPAPIVIDADDGSPLVRHAGDQAFLHRRVVIHGAVAIEMIFAEVDQDADRGIERGSEIDLVGRALDDVNAARARRLERQDRGADIAAELRVEAGRRREMRDQRRGGRFAVGAGDGDERRVGREAAALAAEQLDIADHLDGGFLRKPDHPMRRRMGERNAGRQHQRRDPRPVGVAQIGGGNAGGIGLRHALRIVVVADDVGAAGKERTRAHQPRAAQPEHGDLFAGEGRDRDHDEATSASGSRARPAPARPRRSRSE